jgi:ERF superfamily protein
MDMDAEKGLNVFRDVQIDVGFDTMRITGDPTKLYEELAKAQAEFTAVPKTSDGQIGQQKFKYAGYATLVRCVRPALSAHGITLFQPLHSRGGMAVTTTILAGHGASISSSFEFKAAFTKKQKDGTVVDDPQEFGRAHTYYRRYQLQAMLGIEGDKDADDLADVNTEKTQYVEPKAEPKAEKKGPVSAAATSVSAEEKPTPSATPSASTTPPAGGKAKPAATTAAPADTTKTLNELLQSAMAQLKWKMPEVKEFFKEHIDPAGFESAANLTLEAKRALYNKMIEKHDLIPF